MDKANEDLEPLRLSLAECLEEYRDANDTWKTLELKARILLTVAGVYTAALLTFMNSQRLADFTRVWRSGRWCCWTRPNPQACG